MNLDDWVRGCAAILVGDHGCCLCRRFSLSSLLIMSKGGPGVRRPKTGPRGKTWRAVTHRFCGDQFNSVKPQVFQAKMCKKIKKISKDVFYRRLSCVSSLWTARGHSGAHFWRVFRAIPELSLTRITRRRPLHSMDHKSHISASISKAYLNLNAWTPELQIHTSLSLVLLIELSENAHFCSKSDTLHSHWLFITMDRRNQW